MKQLVKLLVGCNLALLAFLPVQAQDSLTILAKSYTMQDLVTLSDSGSVLLPLQINGLDTNLIMHTSYEGLLLDSKFAKTAKVKGNPTNRRPDYDVSLTEDSKLSAGRITTMRSGSGRALRIMRGEPCLIGETTLPVAASYKKMELPIGGVVGLDTIKAIRPIVDFGAGKLLIPYKNTQVGLFSSIMARENFMPVIMVRDIGEGPYYIILKIKRKDYAFQVDLNRRDCVIDTNISKQMGLEVAAEKTTLTNGTIGPVAIDDYKFRVAEIERAGRNVAGYRFAGMIGTDFFKNYKIAIDFAWPIAVIPTSK